jgi:hypothetical protein
MEDNGSIEEYTGRKNKLRRQATGDRNHIQIITSNWQESIPIYWKTEG